METKLVVAMKDTPNPFRFSHKHAPFLMDAGGLSSLWHLGVRFREIFAMHLARGRFAAWRGRRFGAQLARLERQLARAPGNVESRSRLLLAYAGELIDDFLVKCWNPKELVNTEHLNCWL